MELLSAEVGLSVIIWSAFWVFSEEEWSSICDYKLNMANSKRLPKPLTIGKWEMWNDWAEGDVRFFDRLIVSVCVVWAHVVIIHSVHKRHVLQQIPHCVWFEYLVVCLLKIIINGMPRASVVHVANIAKELIHAGFFVLLSHFLNWLEHVVIAHCPRTRRDLCSEVIGEQLECFEASLLFNSIFSPVFKSVLCICLQFVKGYFKA